MAVPKRRRSRTARNMRRSHLAKKPLQLARCPKCGEPKLPHTACGNCGTYNGRDVLNVVKKIEKQERKDKAKRREA